MRLAYFLRVAALVIAAWFGIAFLVDFGSMVWVVWAAAAVIVFVTLRLLVAGTGLTTGSAELLETEPTPHRGHPVLIGCCFGLVALGMSYLVWAGNDAPSGLEETVIIPGVFSALVAGLVAGGIRQFRAGTALVSTLFAVVTFLLLLAVSYCLLVILALRNLQFGF
jgi:hypothetical protein